MPYVSRAQQGLFHSPNSPVSAGVVKEFDNASRGQHGLPYHVGRPFGRPTQQRSSRSEALARALVRKGRRPGAHSPLRTR